MSQKFILELNKLGYELNKKQLKQLEDYFEFLVEYNEKVNLTNITEKEDVYIKHFLDSINIVRAHNFTNENILDVGAGAGFPSIPLLIVEPNINVTIIDSLNKRVVFLNKLINKIGVSATLIHGRAEEHMLKNHYDIVTARAVSNLRMLSELCMPFVKLNGIFIPLKGPKIDEEIQLSSNAIDILGGKLEKIVKYDLLGDQRNIPIIRKVKLTKKKYPRKFAKIKASPL